PQQSNSSERSTVSARGNEGAPDRIGPYVLLGKLGEGGMGRVYRAEQTSPVRRQVALKLVRAGMDNDEVLARFESERQALALLNHPNIAQVYDAGTAEDGRPYFAMEYVAGAIITDFVRQQKLPIRERLELFLQICDGVQHAHQKGIIHRDLKPSNILVAMQDGKPVPKIIDFGVAKATAHRLTDRSLHTMAGQIVGTLAYMSPEQAAGGSLDVDTRSDVYALGMLLYELLAGVHPFGAPDDGSGSYEEYLRRIRTEEPKAPSTRLSSLGVALEHVAADAGTDRQRLIGDVRGDLDWITLKAIEKDRARRYASASELAEDVRRHLRDEPVAARPPSGIYRFRKFARRNRAAVVAGSLVTLALVSGIIGTSIGMARARRAQRAALNEAETSQQTTKFLLDLFKVSDTEYVGKSTTARELLDRGATRIRDELKDRPLIRASLLQTIGNTYAGLGCPNDAIPLQREALGIKRKLLGPDDVETGRSFYSLASNYLASNAAEPYLLEALRILRKRLGPDHQEVSWCHNDLAMGYMDSGDYGRALKHFQEAARIKKQTLGPAHEDYLMTLNNIAFVYLIMGDTARARPMLEFCLAHLDTTRTNRWAANVLDSYGALMHAERDPQRARFFLTRSLAMQESLVTADHPVIGSTLERLARVDLDLGRLNEARSEAERALAIAEKGGSASLLSARCLRTEASVMERLGRKQAALRVQARAASVLHALRPAGLVYAGELR
ncbi:MAG: protein kinase domain-containing protein, partial [Bacteroidota bacterium]